MFGDPREMVLHYFLADDTVEIREIIHANAGRDAVPLFLRRQRLPKVTYMIQGIIDHKDGLYYSQWRYEIAVVDVWMFSCVSMC